jgi:hypothetical protein
MLSESVDEYDWNCTLTMDIRSIRNSRVQKGKQTEKKKNY